MKKAASGSRAWWAVGLAGWAAVSILALGLTLFAFWYRQSADYPGSLYMGDHTIYKFGSVPTVRRDTSYRSTDDFSKIYQWYSVGFNLGPEVHALSGCILMARSFTDFGVVQREMSVTLCNTPKERMIFVMRSLALRWR